MKKITDLCARYDMDEEDLKVLNESVLEYMKKKMDDIKEEIEEIYIGDISDDGRKEVIEIINKHLGDSLKWHYNQSKKALKKLPGEVLIDKILEVLEWTKKNLWNKD